MISYQNNMLLCTGIISFDLVKIDFHVNCHQLDESPFILDQNSGIKTLIHISKACALMI